MLLFSSRFHSCLLFSAVCWCCSCSHWLVMILGTVCVFVCGCGRCSCISLFGIIEILFWTGNTGDTCVIITIEISPFSSAYRIWHLCSNYSGLSLNKRMVRVDWCIVVYIFSQVGLSGAACLTSRIWIVVWNFILIHVVVLVSVVWLVPIILPMILGTGSGLGRSMPCLLINLVILVIIVIIVVVVIVCHSIIIIINLMGKLVMYLIFMMSCSQHMAGLFMNFSIITAAGAARWWYQLKGFMLLCFYPLHFMQVASCWSWTPIILR